MLTSLSIIICISMKITSSTVKMTELHTDMLFSNVIETFIMLNFYIIYHVRD